MIVVNGGLLENVKKEVNVLQTNNKSKRAGIVVHKQEHAKIIALGETGAPVRVRVRVHQTKLKINRVLIAGLKTEPVKLIANGALGHLVHAVTMIAVIHQVGVFINPLQLCARKM